MVSDTLKKGDIKQPSVTLLTSDLLLKEVKANVFDTSALFATPEVVEKLIPIAPVVLCILRNVQILGPRRLMPSTKNGTVSEDIAEAIRVEAQRCLNPSAFTSRLLLMRLASG